MKSLIILTFVSIMSLLLASCGSQTAEDNTTPIEDRTPVAVKTKVAGVQSSSTPTVLSGQIQAKNQATVSSRMMGYVTSLNLEVGDRVSAGQTILNIKNNELPAKRAQIDASITEAKAALQNVKVNYDRMKILWEQESITRKEWDDISSQYDMMKAKVDGANSMRSEIDEAMTYTKVVAPISGVITAKMINRGDLVNPGVPLMTIEGNQGYEVATSVSDAQIGQIKKGMTLDVDIKPLKKRVKATVSEISPSAINTGGQFRVIADLKLDKADLKMVFPGMYTNVYAPLLPSESSSESTALIIDKSAIVERGQLVGIYTISNQETAMLRWIQTGKDYGESIEVVGGLKAGEAYVISNIDQLVDGVPVTQ